MNRRNFITYSCLIGVSGTVIGALTKCSKDSDPSPGGGNPGGNKLTADLSTELMSVGSSKTKNNVIIVRTAEGNSPGSFVALTSICTHEACTVGYQSGTNQFVCPCHGSVYSITGSVIQGPAPSALTRYTITIDGNMLTVS